MSTKKAEAIGQFDLFGGAEADESITSVFDVKIPDEEWDSKHRLGASNERCWGCMSPVTRSTASSTFFGSSPTRPSPRYWKAGVQDGAQVTLGGIIASVDRRVNKNGLTWCIVQLEDLVGGIEVLFTSRRRTPCTEWTSPRMPLCWSRLASRSETNRMSLIGNDLAGT